MKKKAATSMQLICERQAINYKIKVKLYRNLVRLMKLQHFNKLWCI